VEPFTRVSLAVAERRPIAHARRRRLFNPICLLDDLHGLSGRRQFWGTPKILLDPFSGFSNFCVNKTAVRFSSESGHHGGRQGRRGLGIAELTTRKGCGSAYSGARAGRVTTCGSLRNLEVHHKTFRSQSGDDSEFNLIALCNSCHGSEHDAALSPGGSLWNSGSEGRRQSGGLRLLEESGDSPSRFDRTRSWESQRRVRQRHS
jgi:HNH endonuclease